MWLDDLADAHQLGAISIIVNPTTSKSAVCSSQRLDPLPEAQDIHHCVDMFTATGWEQQGATAPAEQATTSPADQLRTLKKLHDEGTISDADHQAKKAEIPGRM